MNELKIIKEQVVLGKDFKVYGDIENPLFVAKDVAEWIGYDVSSVNKMIKAVDTDECHRNLIPTGDGNRETWCLTEEGLYEVLMLSRKKIARDFKKEVKKILKDIRQNGMHITTTKLQDLLDKPETLLEIVTEYAKVKKELSQAQPMIELATTISNTKDTLTMREFAVIINIGRNILFKELRKLGILDRNNLPYQMHTHYFKVVEKPYNYAIGKVTLVRTDKQDLLINKLKKEGIIE